VESDGALFSMLVRKHAGQTTTLNPLHPFGFNGLTAGWSGVIRGRFGRILG
jgi:hypothetical protein